MLLRMRCDTVLWTEARIF